MGKNYIPSTKQQDKIRTDMIGMRFGRLVVQSYSHSKKNEGRAGYKHYYNCICDCGNTYIGERNALRFHNTESCGCIHSETLIKRNQETASHNGDSKKYQRLYNIWYSIRNRCDSLSNKDYRYYGGKGVKVCNEWYEWENFKQWALGNGYEEDLTIDRIDVDGDYKPSNCRWVTMQVQANNKTVNHYIIYDGRTQSLSDWCRELNLDYDRTKQRINACGMTPEQAFKLSKYYTQRHCHNDASERANIS